MSHACFSSLLKKQKGKQPGESTLDQVAETGKQSECELKEEHQPDGGAKVKHYLYIYIYLLECMLCILIILLTNIFIADLNTLNYQYIQILFTLLINHVLIGIKL